MTVLESQPIESLQRLHEGRRLDVDGIKLTNDLVAYLRSRSKPPIVLSEIALLGSWGSRGRLDVAALTIAPHYAGWHVDGYEVKASRKDLFNDLDAGKWRRYLAAVERFYFAFPAGLAKVSELPDDVGVMTCTEGGRWQRVRRSPTYGGSPDQGGLLRIIRRLDGMRDDAERRETKLSRLERLAEVADELRLRYHLSEKAKAYIRSVEDREHALIERERAVERREGALEGAGDVLDLVDRLLRGVGSAAHLAASATGVDRWSSPERRDQARTKLQEAVAALEGNA